MQLRLHGLDNPDICPYIPVSDGKFIVLWQKGKLFRTFVELSAKVIFLVSPDLVGEEKGRQAMEIKKLAHFEKRLNIVVLSRKNKKRGVFPQNVVFRDAVAPAKHLNLLMIYRSGDYYATLLEDLSKYGGSLVFTSQNPKNQPRDYEQLVYWESLELGEYRNFLHWQTAK